MLAAITSDGRPIGSVYTDGHPQWLEMTVNDPGMSGPVTCYVIAPGGQLVRLGTFDLVNGKGYWGAPLGQAGSGTLKGVELVAAGHVIGTATFAS